MKSEKSELNKNNNGESNKTNQVNKSFTYIPNKKIINKIMNKYNVTENEAEQILIKIENKIKTEQKSAPTHQKNQNLIPNKNQLDTKYNLKEQNTYLKSKKMKQSSHNLNISPFNNTNNEINNQNPKIKNSNIIKTTQINEKKNHNYQNKKNNSETVDNLLSDIIPEYNKNISIDVQNIDLTFEVPTEKVDTFKESIIRILKRNKPEKMKIHAVNNISFKIYKGEKIGIIGYNGAGKSTLLNIICGIYKPNKGQVLTNGNISPLLGLGAGFDHNYSGRKNIYFNGAVLGYSKNFLREKEKEIIEFSELGEFIDIPVKNYSSGMMAKLAFSIATVVNPDILIIDEILGVGDINFAKKSRDKIRSLMDGGTTVLLVSHSIPQIRELCDKAIWIDNGMLKEMGDVNKVCDNYLKDSEKATNEQLANIQLR